jgi:hypothetical protein
MKFRRRALTLRIFQNRTIRRRSRQGQNNPDKLVRNVFFCHVATAEQLRGTTGITSDIWKRINQNKDERYHFLQKIEVPLEALHQGLPELGIDLKHYFTIPTEEIYKRIEIGEVKRRCILVSPYLEHLSSLFAHFLSRTALPKDHFSEPAVQQQLNLVAGKAVLSSMADTVDDEGLALNQP